MGRLEGKKALITAAGQGVGKASAMAMTREGAKVIATDIDAQALACLYAERIETHVLNVRDKAAIVALANKLGPLDVLFNGAGFVASGTILDCDEDQWSFCSI